LEESFEGSLVHFVQAGFVAVEEFELVGFGQAGKGGGYSGADCGICSGFGGLIKKFGFDPPEAAHSPAGGYHFIDQILFDVVFGLEFFDVIFEDLVEDFAVFAFEDNAVGEKAVTEGVHAGPLAPRFCFGAT
jgi:hypothetical protein